MFVRNSIKFGASNFVPSFFDVGYIPAHHAKEIKEKGFQTCLLGATEDGAGLSLDIILYQKDNSFIGTDCKLTISDPEPENIQPTFLSLKKMRKFLEA